MMRVARALYLSLCFAPIYFRLSFSIHLRSGDGVHGTTWLDELSKQANTMRNMYNQQWKVDMSSSSSSSSDGRTTTRHDKARHIQAECKSEKDRRGRANIYTQFFTRLRAFYFSFTPLIVVSHLVRTVWFSVIFAVCASFSVCLCVSVADDWYTFYRARLRETPSLSLSFSCLCTYAWTLRIRGGHGAATRRSR